jgi:hypothetical protein
MQLKEYFSQVNGTGVLCTADAEGVVDVAIYARPHVTDDGRVAFLMRERLTWHNIDENPNASYLFMEQGHAYTGIRMRLIKEGEVEDDELIARMTRDWLSPGEDLSLGPKHLVYFRIVNIRKLIGDEEPGLTWDLQ